MHTRFPWANPLASASIALVLVLYVLHVPYAQYRAGGDLFSYLLWPATVALGVPMYKQAVKLKGSLRRLFVVVLAGSIVGMVTSGVVAWLLGASHEIVMSAIPKSVTTPIAIEVSKELQGDPTITAALVLLSGLLGSMVGPGILRMARILHEDAVGSAIGTSSHAQLASESSSWPVFHHDLNHTGRSPFDTSKDLARMKWSFAATDHVESSPAIGADGTVYVGADDHKLYALGADPAPGPTATPGPLCGNGTIDPGEACDPPNSFCPKERGDGRGVDSSGHGYRDRVVGLCRHLVFRDTPPGVFGAKLL